LTEWDFVEFQGYHVRFSNPELLSWALEQPAVKYIESNKVVNQYACTTQTGTPWGLSRITLGKGKLPGELPADRTYPHSATAGKGVSAYIIDTGIRITHQEFGGRAIYGADFTGNKNGAADGNGHGTHVAGTIGGKTYGVAKAVTLVAVKVLSDDGSGSNAGVISGIQWAQKNATGKRAVANLSLGGGISTAVDDAIMNLNKSGVSVVVAAGNEAADACNSSPARSGYAITVAAADKSDIGASFTNRGKCVNVIAPGVAILSAWYSSDKDENTISGTSMASPHVAGIVAYVLGNSATALSPIQVTKEVLDNLAFVSTIVISSTTTKLYAQAPSC